METFKNHEQKSTERVEDFSKIFSILQRICKIVLEWS